MKKRCFNRATHNYALYGGRGITVCDAWRDDFATFLRDVGPRPSLAHTLDRIDNDGDYEPGNVRWATAKQQGRNTRRNVNITALGETLCLAAWQEHTGIAATTIANRLRLGLAPALAVTQAPREGRLRYLTINNVRKTVTEWAAESGISRFAIYMRLNAGWPVERAVFEPTARVRALRYKINLLRACA